MRTAVVESVTVATAAPWALYEFTTLMCALAQANNNAYNTQGGV